MFDLVQYLIQVIVHRATAMYMLGICLYSIRMPTPSDCTVNRCSHHMHTHFFLFELKVQMFYSPAMTIINDMNFNRGHLASNLGTVMRLYHNLEFL